MCKVCARSSPLRSTLNTSYIRFGHVSSMYRSSPLRSTLNTNVITHHSKSYIFPSKSKDLSPPAGSALFVRSTKTAGPRVFTMCQNIENHTDICKPWANYHASSNCLQLNFSSGGIDGLGLCIKCFTLRAFSIHSDDCLFDLDGPEVPYSKSHSYCS